MAYVTTDELREALSSQPGARTAATLEEERLQVAVDEAEAEVVGKLSSRYALPANVILPGLVRGIILAVAAYLATLEWMQGKDLTDRDPVVLRYVRAREQLKELHAGLLLVALPPAGGGATGGTSDDAAYNTTPDLQLTREAHIVATEHGWYGEQMWLGR